MRMDLPEDPAVFKLAGITGMDRFAVVGRLYAFWSWADHHAVDGRVDGATSQVVDAVTQLNGFSDALVKVRWLEIGDGFIAIPKHERHNGTSAKERALKNQRQERWRRGKSTVDDNVGVKASTKASTREEKRRSKPPVVPLGFERFWKAWPPHERKQAKGKCCEVWATLGARGSPTRSSLTSKH
jgi:hypothetical protein